MNEHNIPEGGVLDSVFEIEDLLETIANSEKKIAYYEKLKKHRSNVIDEKINQLELEKESLRKVIFDTMKTLAPDDKTVDFPGVGKAVRKKTADKWVVEDEDKVLDYLETNKLNDAIKVTKKIVKKELDKVLNAAEKRKEVIPGVNKEAGEETLSISFDKDYKPSEEKQKKTVSIEVEELDELEV